ncbi:MAG: DUF116 domain-containing protein [Firmicutes bacterium]|nr:DUF116 domain-containing protein [Bacillota bacterium]
MRARKRLFIGLLGLGVALILLLVIFTVYLAINWERPLNRIILLILALLIIAVLGIVSFGIAGIILTLWSARTIPSFEHLIRVTLTLLFPISLMLGRILGFGQEKVQASFVEVNNQLVRARRKRVLPGQLLLLAPHCLQNAECPHKITLYPDNCKRCGRCQVSELLSLRDRYGIRLAFATGGTLARRFIQLYRPQAIIAIACERDLASGIQDTSPLPVLGVLNQRPYGPCFNTRVDLKEVEGAVLYFLQTREPREQRLSQEPESG